MEWNAAVMWWVATGVLVVCELTTGTFYLLMVALGAAAGAVAAHLGFGQVAQMVVAALVGAGATAAWHIRRKREPAAAPAQSNPDVNMDIGQRVKVEAWGSDGSARVHYRGASWAARYAGAGSPAPGEYVIVALDGSELRVAPAAAH